MALDPIPLPGLASEARFFNSAYHALSNAHAHANKKAEGNS